MKIAFKPHPAQLEILKALEPPLTGMVVMVIAGRRFGKTVLACNEIIRRAIMIPGARIWYVAPTRDQAYTIAWRVMLKYLPAELVKKKREDVHIIELTNGSLIEFKGVQHQVFLLGAGLHFVVLDEFPTIPYTVWYDVIKPMLVDFNGDALFIGSVPDPRVHSITQEFIDMFEEAMLAERLKKPKPGLRAFTFSTLSNPYINQNKLKSDIEELKRKGRESDAERIYHGAYTKNYGLVFPQFNYEEHTCEPFSVPAQWIRVMAVDPHPQKPIYGLWAARDPNDEIWIYREHIFVSENDATTPLTVPESTAVMRKLEEGESVRIRLIDPTYAKVEHKTLKQKSIFRQYAELGVYFKEGNRDFMTFFEEMTDRLRAVPHPTIHIFRTCQGLINQLRSYTWDSYISPRAREERGAKDKPKPVNDDFISCLKYILTAHIPKQSLAEARNQAMGMLNKRWAAIGGSL